MESENLPELKHIVPQHQVYLAVKTGMSREYIRLLMKGQRNRNTIRAKAIYAAACELNLAIEKGLKKADRKLMVIEDAD